MQDIEFKSSASWFYLSKASEYACVVGEGGKEFDID